MMDLIARRRNATHSPALPNAPGPSGVPGVTVALNSPVRSVLPPPTGPIPPVSGRSTGPLPTVCRRTRLPLPRPGRREPTVPRTQSLPPAAALLTVYRIFPRALYSPNDIYVPYC